MNGVNKCYGWHYVKTDSLSIIKETMPSMRQKRNFIITKEHNNSFIYYRGVATFEINELRFTVGQNNGIHIKPGFFQTYDFEWNAKSDLE